MAQFVVRVLITGVLVVVISEAAKQSKLLGGIIASLPLTSILALSWLSHDSSDTVPIADLSMDIFWAVIPSLAFFPLLAWLLRYWQLSYIPALLIASLVTAGFYFVYFLALRFLGLRT